MTSSAAAVASYRRRQKLRLVASRDYRCHDCRGEFAPFVFDFDHRDPADKAFGLGHNGTTRSFEKMRAEAEKCDMVCANCHRWRTHRQRCDGCELCVTGLAQ